MCDVLWCPRHAVPTPARDMVVRVLAQKAHEALRSEHEAALHRTSVTIPSLPGARPSAQARWAEVAAESLAGTVAASPAVGGW